MAQNLMRQIPDSVVRGMPVISCKASSNANSIAINRSTPSSSSCSTAKAIKGVALSLIILTQTACGTLLHPERNGQRAGRIDPAIAILNGVGILFYAVPGLVAFAVDFSNGTIYLPGTGVAGQDREFKSRTVAVDGPLDQDKIQAVIAEQLSIENVLEHDQLVVY